MSNFRGFGLKILGYAMTLRERIIFSLLLVASLCCGQHVLAEEPTSKLDSVTLQLKWKHQFQFAGYYAAKEKGFYKDAGLEVNRHY